MSSVNLSPMSSVHTVPFCRRLAALIPMASALISPSKLSGSGSWQWFWMAVRGELEQRLRNAIRRKGIPIERNRRAWDGHHKDFAGQGWGRLVRARICSADNRSSQRRDPVLAKSP